MGDGNGVSDIVSSVTSVIGIRRIAGGLHHHGVGNFQDGFDDRYVLCLVDNGRYRRTIPNNFCGVVAFATCNVPGDIGDPDCIFQGNDFWSGIGGIQIGQRPQVDRHLLTGTITKITRSRGGEVCRVNGVGSQRCRDATAGGQRDAIQADKLESSIERIHDLGIVHHPFGNR